MFPDTALLLLTAGILLVYIELNRPGLIVPGAVGLILTLLAAAQFLHAGVSLTPAAACMFGFTLLLLSTRTRWRLLPAFAATAALAYAFVFMAPASSGARPHARVAVPCAVILGAGTSLLTTIAARARQNKGLDLK